VPFRGTKELIEVVCDGDLPLAEVRWEGRKGEARNGSRCTELRNGSDSVLGLKMFQFTVKVEVDVSSFDARPGKEWVVHPLPRRLRRIWARFAVRVGHVVRRLVFERRCEVGLRWKGEGDGPLGVVGGDLDVAVVRITGSWR
jgi:hypothetical protein